MSKNNAGLSADVVDPKGLAESAHGLAEGNAHGKQQEL